jgi:hypothetical protein
LTGLELVCIRWRDAGARHGTWQKPDGLDFRFELQSAGFLVNETEEAITIATDYDGERYRDISSIPKACVLDVRRFAIT